MKSVYGFFTYPVYSLEYRDSSYRSFHYTTNVYGGLSKVESSNSECKEHLRKRILWYFEERKLRSWPSSSRSLLNASQMFLPVRHWGSWH